MRHHDRTPIKLHIARRTIRRLSPEHLDTVRGGTGGQGVLADGSTAPRPSDDCYTFGCENR